MLKKLKTFLWPIYYYLILPKKEIFNWWTSKLEKSWKKSDADHSNRL